MDEDEAMDEDTEQAARSEPTTDGSTWEPPVKELLHDQFREWQIEASQFELRPAA